MELELPWFLILSLLILTCYVLVLKGRSTKTSNSKLKFPPGPWKLPIIGSIHHLVGSHLPHQRLRDLAQTYGPVMNIKLCEKSTIFISSAEAAKHIYKTHDLIFAQRPHSFAGDIVSYGSTGIALSPYGDYWRQMRKLCTLELLSARRVRSYHSIREQEMANLRANISDNIGSCINLSEMIYGLMFDIIARAAFGERFKEQKKIIEVVQQVTHDAAGFSFTELFPSQKWLHDIAGETRKYHKLHQKTDKVLENIIKGVALKAEDGEAQGILSVLMNLKEEGELEFPLTMDNIKAVILDMIVGATKTSSVTLEWAMSEMLKNPRTMRKAQAEVRQVFSIKGYVEEADLQKLDYLKAVIKETLRLHPPLPMAVPREARESCEIEGFMIPKGTQVFVNLWAILRDPKHWNEAEIFQPERFVGSGIDYTSSHFEYKPFGAGKRTCPGLVFALPNLELPLAQLLYYFNWELPAGTTPETLDMTGAFGFTFKKERDLLVIPTAYIPTTTSGTAE